MNCFVSCVVTMTGLVLAQDAGKPSRIPDSSDTFFTKGLIPELRIQISEDQLEQLKSENRKYVRCTIVENRRTTYRDVGIKLKGAAGSFREFDDRPALTLNSAKFYKGQTFHALTKFHLNNSVQDETYIHEWLCEELFRAAGIPAPRVTHARVWLNDRDVGLYVLKEGFDRTFLKRHFENPHGNLYDGGFLQDVDQDLEKDSGDGPDDHSDLKQLLDACREQEPAERIRKLQEILDIEAFITFMAMEEMACHWDGYTRNSNNYRIYFNPTDKKAHFLPHGMDQMFGDATASILEMPGPIVSSAVMQNEEWRARYRQRVKELLPLFAPPDKLQERVEVLAQRLHPILEAIDPEIAANHTDRARELKDQLAARAENLVIQSELPEPTPETFDENGELRLSDWHPASESEDAVIDEVELPGDKRAYSIQCGPSAQCVASWRRKLQLPQGDYTFHALVQTRDAADIEDEKGSAAGIRISGTNRTNSVAGTTKEWQPIEFQFTVDEEKREVELVAELRTSQGRVWFDADSLRLTRQPIGEQQ